MIVLATRFVFLSWASSWPLWLLGFLVSLVFVFFSLSVVSVDSSFLWPLLCGFLACLVFASVCFLRFLVRLTKETKVRSHDSNNHKGCRNQQGTMVTATEKRASLRFSSKRNKNGGGTVLPKPPPAHV